jgi:hypothetical protein
MAVGVPVVEVADHGHPCRVGGPHGEADAVPFSVGMEVGAEGAIPAVECSLTEQVEIEIGQQAFGPHHVLPPLARRWIVGFG